MTTVEPIRNKQDLKRIEQILEKGNMRDLILFKLGINCGLRISDILALNVSDVKGKKYIRLIEKKTKKKRIIPINTVLKNLLNIYIKDKSPNLPLFASKRGIRLDRVSAYRIINKICNEADLEENIGTHTLRKTFGYHFYQQYKDVVLLQKIFNHSNPAITLRYIGIEQEKIIQSYMNFVL